MPIDKTTVANLIRVGCSFLGTVENGVPVTTSAVTLDLDFWLRMACREFQRYAQMSFVATEDTTSKAEYPNRLKQVANTFLPKLTKVTGDYTDHDTVALLAVWADVKNNLRIPVVISAWTLKNRNTQRDTLARPGADNLWLAKDFVVPDRSDKGARLKPSVAMFVTDLSGRFANLPAGQPFVRIGGYTHTKGSPYGGPDAGPASCNKPMSYTLMSGATVLPPEGPELSTYRVVSAIAGAEASQNVDAINGFDAQILSVGPYQWTFGGIIAKTGLFDRGELGALMAYAKRSASGADGDSFTILMQEAGMDVSNDWPDTKPNPLFLTGPRTYTDFITERVVSIDAQGNSTESWPTITDPKRAEFLRGWHSFYKFQAACRYLPSFPKMTWGLARVRIREILSAPWPANATPALDFGGAAGKVGDVFRSELTVALITRWHVKLPGHIVLKGQAGPVLLQAVKLLSSLDATIVAKPVTNWDATVEEMLALCLTQQLFTTSSSVAALETDEISPNARSDWKSRLLNDLNKISSRKYGDPVPKSLALDRTFTLDASNLPPKPDNN